MGGGGNEMCLEVMIIYLFLEEMCCEGGRRFEVGLRVKGGFFKIERCLYID